jgi:hypothetical protein
LDYRTIITDGVDWPETVKPGERYILASKDDEESKSKLKGIATFGTAEELGQLYDTHFIGVYTGLTDEAIQSGTYTEFMGRAKVAKKAAKGAQRRTDGRRVREAAKEWKRALDASK